MFDLIAKTIRTAANVATLPISLAADTVTLGGTAVDVDEPYTVTKGRRILEDAKDVIDEIAS